MLGSVVKQRISKALPMASQPWRSTKVVKIISRVRPCSGSRLFCILESKMTRYPGKFVAELGRVDVVTHVPVKTDLLVLALH